METTLILPQLDMAVIQEKANEFAMKGAIKCLEEYYTGYNSPFRKKIDEELKKQDLAWNMQLPDILALINESLAKEMDAIANHAISKTYIPMISRFFTRVEKEIKFSDILKEFIEAVDPKYPEDCDVSVEENISYGWLNVKIEHEKRTYQLTLHKDRESEKNGLKKYTIIGLPRNTWPDERKDKMIFKMDNGSVEVPFQKDVLKDTFLSYVARIIMCDSLITMDTTEFDESMFPERCHCD